MSEEEENRREIEKSKHDDDDDDRCQQDLIPLDLTFEILSRLPAKSIVRFGCVSKFWSSLTKLPSFIKSFEIRNSSQPPRFLLTFSENTKRFVFSFPQHQKRDRFYSPVYSFDVPNTVEWSYNLSESIHGLVLLHRLVIWNPAMFRFLTLPKPSKYSRSFGNTYLGYDPLEGKHKVLYVSDLYTERPQVLTLGAQESWKPVSNFINHWSAKDFGQCINGILYYEANGQCISGNGEHLIMSFDFTTEKFSYIIFPKALEGKCYRIVSYEGGLAIVNTVYMPNIDLWILKDEDKHEWTYTRFVLPLTEIDPQWMTELYFKGVCDSGELIFTPWSLLKSLYILYFDPRKNSIREAMFEDLVGDEFRSSYGLGKYGRFKMDIIPNHIETLVPF